MVSVYAGTTTALPAYTNVAGVLTANANGAFPTVDNVTLVANDPVAGLVWLQHAAAPSENRVYMLTQQGDGSHPWTLTPALLLTSAQIDGSQINVRFGTTRGGYSFGYCASPAPTLGTTGLAWGILADIIPSIFGDAFNEDFAGMNRGAPYLNTVNTPGGGYVSSTAAPVAGTDTSSENGVLVVSTGSAATGLGAVLFGNGVSGGSWYFSDTDYWVSADHIAVPTLDDGTSPFLVHSGWVNNFQPQNVTIGAYFEYNHAVSGNFWTAVVNNGGGGSKTTVVTSTPIVAAQFYDLRIIHLSYSGAFVFLIDNVVVATINTNLPTTGALLLHNAAIGKASGSGIRTLAIDSTRPKSIRVQGRFQ